MTDIMGRQVKRTSRMWWKMGELCESIALDVITLDDEPSRAIRYAQAAEACYWQATGEGDFTSLSELTSENDSDN